MSDSTAPLARAVLALGLAATMVMAPAVEGQAPSRPPDIYFTPTRHAVAEAMLDLAAVGPNDVVYDLGSGDGRLVILAAQGRGAGGVGIEIQPQLVAQSRALPRRPRSRTACASSKAISTPPTSRRQRW